MYFSIAYAELLASMIKAIDRTVAIRLIVLFIEKGKGVAEIFLIGVYYIATGGKTPQ